MNSIAKLGISSSALRNEITCNIHLIWIQVLLVCVERNVSWNHKSDKTFFSALQYQKALANQLVFCGAQFDELQQHKMIGGNWQHANLQLQQILFLCSVVNMLTITWKFHQQPVVNRWLCSTGLEILNCHLLQSRTCRPSGKLLAQFWHEEHCLLIPCRYVQPVNN